MPDKADSESGTIVPENSYPINTGMVSNITPSSAVVTGFVNLKDEYKDSIVGIMYSTDPLMQNEVETVSFNVLEDEIIDDNGSFEVELTGLVINTEYWYRAYLITTDETNLEGYILSFKTSNYEVSLYTNPASDIFASSATLNGTVKINGVGLDKAKLSFVYGRSDSEDELSDTIGTVSASVASNGFFSAKITDLTSGQKYWYQAICILYDNKYSGKIASFTVNNKNEEVVITLPEYTKCEAVDLHLPSGTKWCSYNLGGKSVTDCGDYYAWGDTLPHYTINGESIIWKHYPDGDGYKWETCPYWKKGSSTGDLEFTRYNLKDEKNQLIPTDDGVKLITILPDIVKSPQLTADWENRLALVSKGDSLKIIEQQEDGRYLVETVNTIRPGEHFLVKPEEITSNPILGVGNEVFNLGDKVTSKVGKVFGKIGRKVEKGLNFLKANQGTIGKSEKPTNTETPSETPSETPKTTPTPSETPKAAPTSPETDTQPEDLNTVTVATKGGNLNFRTGAGTNNSVKGTIKQGTELQVLEDDKNSAWVKVKTSDGEEGYVYRKYVTYEKGNPIETSKDNGIKQKFSEGQKVSVHTRGSRLNIRSGAGTNNSVIGSIENAADIKVLDDDGKSNWVHIVTSDGKEGYVYRDYLEDLNK